MKPKSSGSKAQTEEPHIKEVSNDADGRSAYDITKSEPKDKPITPTPITTKKVLTATATINKGKQRDNHRSLFFILHKDSLYEFKNPKDLQTYLQKDPERFYYLINNQTKIYKKLTKIITVCKRNSAGASSLKKESRIDPVTLKKSLNYIYTLTLVHYIDYTVTLSYVPKLKQRTEERYFEYNKTGYISKDYLKRALCLLKEPKPITVVNLTDIEVPAPLAPTVDTEKA
ncbi:hypothetical protein N7509_003869 [Penicillium cosmopolitanum]|uniref:Uncharacterized protein n=1 Tax=Penicillium cosmopolitanum TaxID=1131564 RepID=A0A9W9W5T7_9EURO|nr:uncharacterized protein N7509_003869 [Penicillium cosmopolitanum]KAJ5403998.1 hypothetical protein N7509_003869 [Penicillium cosmopolitanum]